MAALRELGGEDWFALGDHDLALHIVRTARLASGVTLSAITADFARAWGIGATIMPMSEQPVATHVRTARGWIEFQHYFVRQRCEPIVHGIAFQGATEALPAPGVVSAIIQAEVILIAPSNPLLSIDPLLAVPGIRAALAEASAPVVAVSPIIGGQAIKGPTAKLMKEMGQEVSNTAIARHYQGVIDGLVIDTGDEAPEGIAIERTDTMMRTDQDKARVAKVALNFALRLRRG